MSMIICDVKADNSLLTIKRASYIILPIRRSGEIGRRTGLKIQRPRGHAGSTPASGTIEKIRLYGIFREAFFLV